MRDLPRAFRQALQVVRRDPGFVSTFVLTLAVGIGATTAALSVAASVLLNPLPVRDESRLLLVNKTLPTGSTLVPFSYAEISAWGEASRTLEAVAGVQYDGAWPWTADFGERVITVTGTAVSGKFFDVLGAQPVLGRLLHAQDAMTGAEVVAVIGHGLWRREFGGNPAVVGQTVRLEGQPATIVGVAPQGFAFPRGADMAGTPPLPSRDRDGRKQRPILACISRRCCRTISRRWVFRAGAAGHSQKQTAKGVCRSSSSASRWRAAPGRRRTLWVNG